MNERDPDLHKLYRAQSREDPPSALDAAILAAAHRAVASGPRKAGAEASRPQRWWMPLAAAAAIGVVTIGIVQQAPKETAIDATSVTTAPAPSSTPAPAPPAAPAPAPPAAPAPAPAPPAAPAPAPPAAPVPAPMTAPPMQAPAASAESQPVPSRDTGALAKKQKEASASKPASEEKLAAARENKVAAEPMPFPAAQAPQKAEAESAKRDAPMEQSFAETRKDSARDERQLAAAAGAAAPPPAAAPAPAPPAAARMRAQSDAAGTIAQPSKTVNELKNAEADMRTLARDPDAWILRIRKLRDDGNVAQAQRELKEFRALVPDAERRLPPDLRSLQP